MNQKQGKKTQQKKQELQQLDSFQEQVPCQAVKETRKSEKEKDYHFINRKNREPQQVYLMIIKPKISLSFTFLNFPRNPTHQSKKKKNFTTTRYWAVKETRKGKKEKDYHKEPKKHFKNSA